MTLKYPFLLLLFLVYIPLIWWYVAKQKGASPALGISTLRAFRGKTGSWKVWLIHFSFVLRLVAIGALIVALCRPQTHSGVTTRQVEGTDIVLALDISGSMMVPDFKPNRFVAAKNVASQFVNARENDNMGIVVFAGESLSLLPLTNDRASILNTISNIDMGALTDGTAIGNGLASAINRVSAGKAKTKSIVLLTDGTNNAGDVPPTVAADIAAEKGIRIYSIGVGTNGVVQYTDPYGYNTTTLETRIDEEPLKYMAKVTGGQYFKATDENMLKDVFAEIDRLEKTRFDVTRFTRTDENFMPWILLAMCAFGLELLLRYLVLRRIP